MCVEVVQNHIESTGYCSWDKNTIFRCRNYGQNIDSGILEYYFYDLGHDWAHEWFILRYHFVTTFGCFWYHQKKRLLYARLYIC